MRRSVVAIVSGALIVTGGCTTLSPEHQAAVNAVANAFTRSSELNIGMLRAIDNPRGDGVLVYVQRVNSTRLVWLHIEGQAHPLNGPSHDATPSLPFPQHAPDRVWQRTRINKVDPMLDVGKLVF
jgi:hypothetical protein